MGGPITLNTSRPWGSSLPGRSTIGPSSAGPGKPYDGVRGPRRLRDRVLPLPVLGNGQVTLLDDQRRRRAHRQQFAVADRSGLPVRHHPARRWHLSRPGQGRRPWRAGNRRRFYDLPVADATVHPTPLDDQRSRHRPNWWTVQRRRVDALCRRQPTGEVQPAQRRGHRHPRHRVRPDRPQWLVCRSAASTAVTATD